MSGEIVSVANEFFLRDGFQATSMDAIASKLGSSKRTLYTRFASKTELFEAVIRFHGNESVAILSPEDMPEGSFGDFLQRCGERFLSEALKPNRIALMRLVTAERRRFPQMLTTVVSAPLAAAAEAMQPAMEKAVADGILPPGDPREYAEQFLSAVCARDVVRVVMGIEDGGLTKERIRRIGTVVSLFVHPRGNASAGGEEQRRP